MFFERGTIFCWFLFFSMSIIFMGAICLFGFTGVFIPRLRESCAHTACGGICVWIIVEGGRGEGRNTTKC